MTTKLKIVRTIIKDRAEMERLVRATVATQIEREGAIVLRDDALNEIGKMHNPNIDALTEEIDNNLTLLEQWSDANPGEFGDARSITVESHRMGYRLGQPKPEPMGKLTWKSILGTLKRWAAIDLKSIPEVELRDRAEKQKAAATLFLRVKADVNKEAMIEVILTKGARAHTDIKGAYINGRRMSPEVVVHEMGHIIEQRNPALLKKSIEFRALRTVGETPRWLGPGYGRHEVALPDEWEKLGGEIYSGKVYLHNGQDYASEILSMGLQRLYNDAVGFWKNDRAYFDFVVNLTRGKL